MSVTATVQKLEDGPRNLVVHLTAELSANTDVESAVKKVDVTTLSTLTNTGRACTHLSLEKVQFSTTNVGAYLLWEGTPNQHLFTMPANFSEHHDFLCTQPIENNATTKTGNVLLTTDAFATAPARYDIVLHFKKKYD